MFVWNSFLIYRLQAITLQLFQMFFTLLKGIVKAAMRVVCSVGIFKL